ncbi:hypothetical protein ETI10_01605 [Macrococcoides goetzii]|nr:hypothetical protein [Macrococcus goetzii]TDM41809.1 hypothetical protein ETI10_01605 [Macrococcus goetzii]
MKKKTRTVESFYPDNLNNITKLQFKYQDAKWRFENHFKDLESSTELLEYCHSYIKALEDENERLFDEINKEDEDDY